MPKPPNDSLPRDSLLRLLATLGIVLAPHLLRLPLWASALVVGVIAWRTLAVLRGWRLLPAALRLALTFGAFAGIYASFGRVSGQTAGVALITVMAALKLTELRARRDTMVMVFLMYFMLITHFLFSQELWTAAYLLVCASLITGVLVEANHPGGALPLRVSLRFGLRFVAQALPLMVVIFILFPRIPGPLWGLPSDAGAARSGLSDSMSPGDISSLIQSDEVAFRVHFAATAPPPQERYWRGPVFAHFDGRTWDTGQRPREAANPVAELEGPAVGYEVVLEPNRTPWLFALELPDRIGLPQDAELNADYQLVLGKGEVRERKLYRLQSHTRYRLQAELPGRLHELYTRLPKNSNPRAQALARQWREQGLGEAAIVDAALARFRAEPYYYTLRPPALGRNGIDEFLFDTRRGFCEHYAGSFTFLMRAAGIPARIVTGYQGGEKNAVGDYYVVRQSDAHAWSEVWLAGRGWLRIDPTAAVSPARIEQGLGDALAGSEFLPAFLDPTRRDGFRFNLAARWDWVNAQWNHWVLGYGPEVQQDFLRRFGLADWSDMILALTVILSLVLGLTGAWLLRRSTPVRREDPARRAWRRLERRLAGAGLPPRPDEGPRDYATRIKARGRISRRRSTRRWKPTFACAISMRYPARRRRRWSRRSRACGRN
ncbi:MAG: protein-glutamine gamma-glutamyltransferase TgpA [Nevskia sp.]